MYSVMTSVVVSVVVLPVYVEKNRKDDNSY